MFGSYQERTDNITTYKYYFSTPEFGSTFFVK